MQGSLKFKQILDSLKSNMKSLIWENYLSRVQPIRARCLLRGIIAVSVVFNYSDLHYVFREKNKADFSKGIH